MKAVRFMDPNDDVRIGALADGTITDAGAAGPRGFVPSPGRVAPGGTTLGGPLAV